MQKSFLEKLFILILALTLAIFTFACGATSDPNQSGNQSQSQASAQGNTGSQAGSQGDTGNQASAQDEQGLSAGGQNQTIELCGPYKVKKVVDGDTIRVMIDGKETKVRFIGINTPESVHNDESKNTDEGKQASDWVKELLTDSEVYLEYDVSRADKYDRTLAYVYLDDGETMVQRLLLEEGLATTTESFENVKYKDEFKSLMKEAKANKAGFWGTGFFH